MLGLGSALTTGSVHEQMYSLSFDGTGDYLTLGDNLDLGTGAFSISLWFNIKSLDSSYQYLISKKQDDNNRIAVLVNNANKMQVVGLIGGVTSFGLVSSEALGDEMAGQWIHVVATTDRAGAEAIYVNGSTDPHGATAASTNDSLNFDNTGPWSIGISDTSSGSGAFQGQIDNVAIFNVALDADAVSAMYNDGRPFDLNYDRGNYDNASGLVGYWKMNDGSGTTVVDSHIGGSINGTLAADATFSANTPDDQTMSNVLTLDGVNDFLSTQADSTAATRGYSFWARSTETATNRGVFSHSDSSALTGTFSFNWTTSGDNANKPIITLEDSGNGFIYFNTTDKQDDGNWHHWFVYIDPTEINNCKCWVDGVTLPESTKAALSAGANAYGPLRIGGGGEYFKGEIDKFAVFDTELAADAVASLAGQTWEQGDTYIANWVVYNTNTKEADSALKITHDGGASPSDDGAKIDLAKTADGGALNSSIIPGRAYKLTCEMKVGSGDTVKLNLGEAIQSSAITSTTFVTVTLYYTPDAAYPGRDHLRFNELNSGGEVWIKSISLIDTEARKNDLTQTIGNYDGDWTDNLINYWKMGNGASDEPQDGIIHDQTDSGYGSELVTGNNSTFDGANDWVAYSQSGTTGISTGGGVLTFTLSGAGNGQDSGAELEMTSLLTAGKTYKIVFDLWLGTETVTTGWRAYIGGVRSDNLPGVSSTQTTFTVYIQTINTTVLRLYNTDTDEEQTGTFFIDNISVRELNGDPGITASGATIIKQPV